jgi:hypothetical protein
MKPTTRFSTEETLFVKRMLKACKKPEWADNMYVETTEQENDTIVFKGTGLSIMKLVVDVSSFAGVPVTVNMFAVYVEKVYPATRHQPEDVDYVELCRDRALSIALKRALVAEYENDLDNMMDAESYAMDYEERKGGNMRYRGFLIIKEGETSFLIKELGVRCGSAWSCVTYIDEHLSS